MSTLLLDTDVFSYLFRNYPNNEDFLNLDFIRRRCLSQVDTPMAAFGGESSDEAALCSHAVQDSGAAGSDGKSRERFGLGLGVFDKRLERSRLSLVMLTSSVCDAWVALSYFHSEGKRGILSSRDQAPARLLVALASEMLVDFPSQPLRLC